MKKFLSSLIISTLFLQGLLAPEAAAASANVWISAPSAVLIEEGSQRILYAKTPHLRRAPASTTKLLTAVVVLDSLALGDVITVPKFAEAIEPSKINLKAGERFRVEDLMRAMLIKSANDAAEVLAVASAGSRAAFAKRMNRKAHALGARHSNFVNASGLPASSQYSTAYDMALIMREAHRHPFIMRTLETRTALIHSVHGRKIYLRNHNKMLWQRGNVLGKTGWTRKARHCFVGSIAADHGRVFVAMLGSHRLWKDLTQLVESQCGRWIGRSRINSKLSVADIRRLQTGLKRSGHNPGTVDGRLGSRTLKAVRSFQRQQGLAPDGVVGPKTWARLKRFL